MKPDGDSHASAPVVSLCVSRPFLMPCLLRCLTDVAPTLQKAASESPDAAPVPLPKHIVRAVRKVAEFVQRTSASSVAAAAEDSTASPKSKKQSKHKDKKRKRDGDDSAASDDDNDGNNGEADIAVAPVDTAQAVAASELWRLASAWSALPQWSALADDVAFATATYVLDALDAVVATGAAAACVSALAMIDNVVAASLASAVTAATAAAGDDADASASASKKKSKDKEKKRDKKRRRKEEAAAEQQRTLVFDRVVTALFTASEVLARAASPGSDDVVAGTWRRFLATASESQCRSVVGVLTTRLADADAALTVATAPGAAATGTADDTAAGTSAHHVTQLVVCAAVAQHIVTVAATPGVHRGMVSVASESAFDLLSSALRCLAYTTASRAGASAAASGQLLSVCAMVVDAATAVALRPQQFHLSHRQAAVFLDACAAAVLAAPGGHAGLFKRCCMLLYTMLRHRLPAVQDAVPVFVGVCHALVQHAVADTADEASVGALHHLVFLPRVFEEMTKVCVCVCVCGAQRACGRQWAVGSQMLGSAVCRVSLVTCCLS